MKELEKVYTELFSGDTDSEYSFLKEKYSESHRYYHTLEHIEDCLQKLQEVHSIVEDLNSLKIALLYHDLFYDPKRKDNEEKSADYTYNLLKSSSLYGNISDKVRKLIILTTHPSIPVTDDEKLLLDIDLSILGANPERYAKYEENIRKEYIHVPKPMYKLGRSKLLKKFLKEKQLFHSDHFHSSYETQARVNLESALKNL